MRKLLGPFLQARRSALSWVARRHLSYHGVKCGSDLRIWSPAFCKRDPEAHISIGCHVTIRNTLRENPAGTPHKTVLAAAAPGAEIAIGNHVGLSGAVLYAVRSITLEDYVNLGAGVRVFDTDFHPLDFAARRVNDEREIASAPVRICRDAFIGAGTIILKGVTVGERAVVGAGSVVTRDVPADTVAGGAPARFLRSLKTAHPYAVSTY